MSTLTAFKLPALDNTLGAMYISIIMSMGLWGIGTLQAYYYYQKYPKDSWQMKSLVAIVWSLDTVHQGLYSHAGYKYMVAEYANVAYLNFMVPTIKIALLISALVTLLVQSFLIYRTYVLSQKNYYLVYPLLALSLAGFSCTIAYFSIGVQMSVFTETLTIAWLDKILDGLMATTDVSITVILVILLNRARTGLRKSETMINRLIIYTVNTGAITSICVLAAVIALSLWPNNLIYVSIFYTSSKLYCNSLLATLNARRTSREGTEGTKDLISITPLAAAHESNGPIRAFAIKVDTSISRADDQGNTRRDTLLQDSHSEVEMADMKATLSTV